MNTSDKIRLAKRSVARTWECDPVVFDRAGNTFLLSERRFFEVLTFGEGAVFRMDSSLYAWCREQFAETKARWTMDGENLYRIETKLREHGRRLCGEHVRYLYLDEKRTIPRPSGYQYALYQGDAVKSLYIHKQFQNALNYSDDVIAYVAYDGEEIAGIAAADDSMGEMWQIGIDITAKYRQRGLAAYLVKTLADAILAENRLPFYTTWSANIASSRVALSCGFVPVWIGYFAE